MFKTQCNVNQKQIDDLMESFLELFKIQVNPFLFKEIKEFVKSIEILKPFPNIPFHFPKKVILSIKQLIGQLEQQSDEIIQQTLTQLKIQIDLQSSPENHLGEAGHILIAANSIKKLTVNQTKKLLNIISKPIQSEIEGFLNDIENNIDNKVLESEIKGQMLKQQKIPNLKTLISQITKEKRLQPSLYQRIMDNKGDMNVFKNKLFYFNNSDYSLTISGKIIESSFENHKANFKFKNNKTDYTISLNLAAGYIDSAVIQYETLNPLKSELEQLNKSLPKENTVILKDAILSVNNRFLNEKTAVLPHGTYDIIMRKRFIFKIGYLLHFVNKRTNNIVEFEIYQDGDKASVDHKNWKNIRSDYSDFLQYYEKKIQKSRIVKFQSAEESNKLISITETSEIRALDVIEKMEEINKLMSNLIGQLQSDSKEVFEELLNELIKLGDFQNSEILNKILEQKKGIQIADAIDLLIQTNKELGFPKTKEEILNEVVTETNYSLLISKEETVDTVRILKLLSDSQQNTEALKGKDIVAFFGSTGSGKSTSVNFFMGIPLEEYQNNFGEKVIRVDTKRCETMKLKKMAHIGQSIGTSETIYSQGHDIIIEDFPIDVRNYQLCDNPGFNDTRGTNYEICTNLSIDQAIDKCGSIKSVVLVVPFSTFTLDRANHIIELTALMKERFPEILEINSDTNKSFHILITKADQKLKEGFSERLNQHIAEENKSISELSQDHTQYMQIANRKARFNLFRLLLFMNDDGRIRFIDINDEIERNEILIRYLNLNQNIQPIPKNGYKKAMDGEDMRESFGKQINLSAHTWTNLILKPFLIKTPAELQQIQQMIQQCNQEIQRHGNNVKDYQNQIKTSELKQQSLQKSLKDIEGNPNPADNEESHGAESSNNEFNYNHEIKKFENQKIENQLQKKQKEDIVIKLLEKMKGLDVKINEATKEIENWEKGDSIKSIVELSFKIGQKQNYGKYDNVKSDEAILKVEAYASETIGSMIIGEYKGTIIYTRVIEAKYSLVPDKGFDPDDYINKNIISGFFSQGRFKLDIKSHRCKLRKMNQKNEGKSIIIEFEMYFVISSKEEDLPYLYINHTIPNEIINKDLIVNKKADINSWQADKKSTQKIIEGYIQEIKELNEEIEELDQKIVNKQEQNKKLVKNGLKEQLKVNLKIIQIDLIDYKKKVSQYQDNIEEKQQLIQGHQLNINKLDEKLRRLAFLISDQMKKNIPQSLYEFIAISFGLNDSFDKRQLQKNAWTSSAQNQNKTFNEYQQMYSTHKEDLLVKIDKYLKIDTRVQRGEK